MTRKQILDNGAKTERKLSNEGDNTLLKEEIVAEIRLSPRRIFEER
jgi:hypothetical protein